MEGRLGGFKEWKCSLCGGRIIEGQRFLVLPRVGLAHIECVAGLLGARGSLDSDVHALLDASEALSYAIVRLKQAEREAGSGEVSGFIASRRREVEKLAAQVEGELGRLLAERGVLGGGGEG